MSAHDFYRTFYSERLCTDGEGIFGTDRRTSTDGNRRYSTKTTKIIHSSEK